MTGAATAGTGPVGATVSAEDRTWSPRPSPVGRAVDDPRFVALFPDRARAGAGDVEALVVAALGRPVQAAYEVAWWAPDGFPAVLRNPPFLDDGTPLPTRWWLIDPDLHRLVGALESAGGVREAEAEVPAEAVADAHARYAAERDADVPDGHDGPRPSGGVGGTGRGLKCLHAHYAWWLAGGDDPVGAWVHQRLVTGPGAADLRGTAARRALGRTDG